MSAEFSISAEVTVCQSLGTDGQSAGYRLPRYSIPPNQKGRADEKPKSDKSSASKKASITLTGLSSKM